MENYFIVPVTDKIAELHAESAEDALAAFVTGMDGDMGTYFRAVTEDEYKKLRDEFYTKDHESFVTDWMQDTILIGYADIPKEDARGCAELAYEIYRQKDGRTAVQGFAIRTWYAAVIMAVEKWLQKK